jgi:phenylalanyl-tRNA synthetase beta chain
MKISLEWLSDFVELTEKDPQKIADRVTTGMGEVDDVVVQGKFLDGVVVGKILSVARHPKADRLSLCEVQTEKGVKKVVCGGTNLREGMCIAFAHVGTTVKHGNETMTLEKMAIRGEDSEGMICAAEEIELEDEYPPKPEDGARPVVDLGDRKDVGTPLKKALGMHDVVLHIDNHAITHRADLFSHRGVAREFVALGLAKWKKSVDFSKMPKVKFGRRAGPLQGVRKYHQGPADPEGERAGILPRARARIEGPRSRRRIAQGRSPSRREHAAPRALP